MRWSDGTPLDDVRVLDLTRIVSGPFATMQLSDLGADIVKIEEPGQGDESRTYGPRFQGELDATRPGYDLIVQGESGVMDIKGEAGGPPLKVGTSVADLVPCGELKTVGEVCEAEQLAPRGQVRTVAHPSAGPARHLASALRLNDQPSRDAAPPPRLGEHASAILSEWLGLDDGPTDELADAGAFGPRPGGGPHKAVA